MQLSNLLARSRLASIRESPVADFVPSYEYTQRLLSAAAASFVILVGMNGPPSASQTQFVRSFVRSFGQLAGWLSGRLAVKAIPLHVTGSTCTRTRSERERG